ncbi:hypothetical protein I302_108832 [Kwoniella bestiolae CBS 10118]|uniref:SCP domain-containing protein n=1 Tax=Kwoniella bestiolae CBS 10118 TaxID=1296100 RepID=A0A1B9FU88_9TREE|nr:hypothetical protein I302_07971 [Kwoniella bestiolae CBS 10118]OCF22324.1 hypothetical protein I302_07971 [Kwoniella bestiolae CBS 10118]
MRSIFLYASLLITILSISVSAHPSGHPRRRHAGKQRRSRAQVQPSLSSSTATEPTIQSLSVNSTAPTAIGLWTPESQAGNFDAAPAPAAGGGAAQPSSNTAIGLFTPPSEDEGSQDSEAGSEGYGGWGGGGGRKGGGGWGGGGGGGWGGKGGWGGGGGQPSYSYSYSYSYPATTSPVAPAGGYGQPAQSQPYQAPPVQSQPYQAPPPPVSSQPYQPPAASSTNVPPVAPPASSSYERPTIYSTKYIEVTEWYTPPVSSASQAAAPAATSSYQPPAAPPASSAPPAGQTDQGAVPTSAPPVAPTPTPSAYNTGYSSSTAGGYSSNAVVTSGGQVVHTSSWKSSWTNSWSNAPSTTSQAPIPTSAPQDDDQRKFVDCHNSWRNQYGAGNVSWGNELAGYANTHASVCASMTHTNGPYGENLAVGTDGFIDIIGSIQMWMDEASEYDANNPTYSHFTQVVWKETTTIGCAAINCGANTGLAGQLYVMCEYYPRGNVIGAFAQNVGKR